MCTVLMLQAGGILTSSFSYDITKTVFNIATIYNFGIIISFAIRMNYNKFVGHSDLSHTVTKVVTTCP